MKRSTHVTKVLHLLNVFLLVMLTVVVFWAKNKLPSSIPVRFDMAGKATGYGSPDHLLTLALVAWIITLIIYAIIIFLPWLSKHPFLLSIPGKQKILSVEREKQKPYWDMVAEFAALLAFCLNLTFYFSLRSMVEIALTKTGQMAMWQTWLGIGLIITVAFVYIFRLQKIAKALAWQKNSE